MRQTHSYIDSLIGLDPEIYNTTPVNTSMTNAHVDIAKYLLLKDILKDKLYQFSDLVEHYLWLKETFISVIEEIEVQEKEELNLLLRRVTDLQH